VDNGAGENDLKRLQRKFQATKASYINVDVKERFMQSAPAGAAHRRRVYGKLLCWGCRRQARRRRVRRSARPPRCAGLRGDVLDVAALEEAHKGLEEGLQRDAGALRVLKDQNLQAR
jgi:hypothetical protein